MKIDDLPEMVTVGEFAEFFRLSKETVRRMVNANTVKSARLGGSIRIPRSEVERLVGKDCVAQ